MAESEVEEIKSLLLRVKEESEQGGLKLNIQTKIMASGPTVSWQLEREIVEVVTSYFLGLQNYCEQWLEPWN